VGLAQSISSEVEPNDSRPTATPIILLNGFAIINGAITSEEDVEDLDYFSFVAPAGARAWIYVDTGGTATTNADSGDSIVTLYEGFTAIEEDDDDGSGNGCDTTTETLNASAIGGRVLTAGGTYYIRVREFFHQGVDPYRLYLVVTTSAPAPEAENNGTPATANSIVTAAAPIGLRAGVIGTLSDQDYYSVVAAAGSTLYINADGDPERDGLGTDLVIDFYATNGTTLLYSANSSTTNTMTDPPAEAFCYTVPVAGTYYVRVSTTNMSTGTYQLMVAGPRSTVQFSSALYTARENSGTATVAVVRSVILAGTVTVQFNTSNGTALAASDYTAVSRTLTFTNGVSTQFVSVPITNDAVIEGNETVVLRLSNPTGGAGLGSLSASVLVILDDDEPPNNTPATATPLSLSSGFVIVTNGAGSVAPAISPPGDEDWYSFTAPAGAKVWAYVDTGGTQGPGATSRDSGLTLFAANGTTVIEEDDDDGSGNDCGPTLEPEGLASAIAGRMLIEGGTYYLRVKAFDTNQIIDPYKLFVVVTTTPAVPETEPNDIPGFANALVTAATPIAERSAQISTADDVDIYSLVAPSNSLFYISADADPERDGTRMDVVLELLGTDGTTVLFTADSSSAETNAAEAFCFRLTQAGRYFVRVTHFPDSGVGSYTLMAARVPAEAEPNDDPAHAAQLDLLSGFARTSGAIAPGNDKDFYSFVAPPGAKVWLTVDTGGTRQAGATSTNSVLTLFGADGVTIIEQDDNDGSGNGCDGTLESGDASAIAGRTLVAGGNYYIRVSASGGSAIINPYTLFAMLTTTAPVPEVEGNDSSDTANPIITVGSAVGLRSGSIGSVGDMDFYSVAAVAGNTLHISADADPERDGIGTDVRVELLSTNGSTVLFSANSSASGSMSDPAAEAFCYVVPTAGTYFVRVQHVSTGTGTYQLMVSRDKIEPPITEVRILALETIGADEKLSFQSQAGRFYRVERTDTLASPTSPWTTLPGILPGTGGVVSYLDVGAAGQSQKFYRVRVEF
jgi:hypothetical protein